MNEKLREERLMILNMLKEGRISVEEANKLLEVIKPSGYHHQYNTERIERKAKRFGESVDTFVKDFNNKIETAYGDVEPMFKKATKSVVEKTVNVIDNISKSLNETLQNMEEELAEATQDEATQDEAPNEEENVESQDSNDNGPREN